MSQIIEPLWQTAKEPMRRFIRARVRDEQTTDDLLQEVFLRAYTHRHNLRDETKLNAWLYQIARNAIIDHYRRAKPTDELVESLVTEETEENLEQQLAKNLPALFEQLPPPYREVLVLSEMQGVPHKEIARQLGISLSGVKSRVQRAREKIRALLEACCEFQFDRLGTIINYTPREKTCRVESECRTPSACSAMACC